MLRLFNTLSRTKEDFIPIEPGKVKMYCCGPTVYNYQHIGNFRTFIFEDLLLRVLTYNEYKVKYIMNITDVGHLVSDSDEGEDKMEKSAKLLGKSIMEIAEYYTGVFKKDSELLNIISPEVFCKATDYIQEQIDLIVCLEKNGFTYPTSDGVYFDTSKFPGYGKLARLDIEGLKEGARIEFSAEKKNITDFALWKFSPENEKRQLEWESPWGKGFPGWHIECSAMSKALLGNHIDIHCGGIDHIPIHHTNEIAQSEACSGEKFVNYWLHCEFLDFGNEKMSKSTGKFITLSTLSGNGYSPMDYRYFLLTAHYRKKQKFSYEALEGARSGIKNLKNKISNLKNSFSESESENPGLSDEYKTRFTDKINDDLNMPEAVAVMWDMLKDENLSSKQKLILVSDFDRIFGLGLDKTEEKMVTLVPDEIYDLIEKRKEAKKSRDFKAADEIRELIKSKGFEIKDTKEGVEINTI
ncbi:MAG: cysteine--tRNA ligase [Ignavibacteria bacterium]|nr:cysteine--tRNA ligase [Ignavibacteria bacterium]